MGPIRVLLLRSLCNSLEAVTTAPTAVLKVYPFFAAKESSQQCGKVCASAGTKYKPVSLETKGIGVHLK